MSDLDTATAPNGRWLSLGPASRLLGIDPDTLRRWADDGRVAAWSTPGGHRRFDRRALERMSADRRRVGAGRPLASLGASPQRLTRVYRQHYATDSKAGGWSAGGPAEDGERDAYRQDGRRLVTVLVDFLDADPAATTTRHRLEDEARAIVADQAARLSSRGTSLTEAVSLFVGARQPFLAELAGLGRRRSLDPARLATLYGDASSVLDRLLLGFIETHQRPDA